MRAIIRTTGAVLLLTFAPGTSAPRADYSVTDAPKTTPDPALESEHSVSAAPPPGFTLDPAYVDALPGVGDEPGMRRMWLDALKLEEQSRFVESAVAYEKLADQMPASSFAYWRAARAYWRVGDSLAEGATEAKIHYFELGENWARRGMELDPECAECMLWRYASLGRLITNRGLISGVRYAGLMQELLDDGIELQPTHREAAWNTTLGNLYYARAIFNRMVPDWFWLKWVVGVRGNKELALTDIDAAIAISMTRIDYHVEKGAVLMCLGTAKKKPERIEEGRQVLKAAFDMEQRLGSDAVDLEYARVLIKQPGKACGFSRDGFIDVEEAGRSL